MAEFETITVQKRTATGKGVSRRLRAQGVIPAVFYTSGGEAVPVQVAEGAMNKLFEKMGRTTLFNVEIEDGDKKEITPALIWDVDYYPTKKRFQHVDFFGVDLKKEIKLRVPLVITGVPKGVKLGGVLETYFEYVIVVGKPLDLPNKITVDITDMGLGATLRVGDIALPDGVRPAFDGTRAVIHIKDKSASSADDENGEGAE